MARGWESKSVEQQQAELAEHAKPTRAHLTRAQRELNRKREGLLLSRKRLTDQLEVSTHDVHRQMLLRSIAEIDKQLASFQ